jgi:putative transcriptional regulator
MAQATAAQIEAEAARDAENPPVSQEKLRRAAVARFVRRIREGTGLSQPAFAAEFGLSVGRLRDYEQGRFVPDVAALVLLRLIADDPAKARLLVGNAEEISLFEDGAEYDAETPAK